MVITESVDAFWESLPQPSIEVREVLYLNIREPDENAIESVKLAYRGFLGCVAFADAGNDRMVIRLHPGYTLANSPVAIAWSTVTEGITIAPDIKRFVAGRLAHIDAANPDHNLPPETRHKLVQFASEFGSVASTEAVLDAIDTAQLIQEPLPRRGALWAAADPNEPLFQALAACWSLRGKAISDWSAQAIYEIPNNRIVWRIYLATQLRNESDADLSDVAWKLIMDNDVFDSTYTGYTRGPATADWENEPLIQIVSWLQKNNIDPPNNVPTKLWEAAQVYAQDPLGYEGTEHFNFAKTIASDNPILAYTHAANAAAFWVRATQQKPSEAIVFAHELAEKNKWEDLRLVLDWTKSYLNLDL